MPLSVTFSCSIQGYTCNFSETYHGRFTHKHVKRRVGSHFNWVEQYYSELDFQNNYLIVLREIIIVLLGFPPPHLLAIFRQFADIGLKRIVHIILARVVI